MEQYCQICGQTKGLDQHHIRPKSLGGGDEPENLITLCRYHHMLVQQHKLDLEKCDIISGKIPGYEEMAQRAVDCMQSEQDAKWALGAVCAILANIMAVPKSQIAALLNCSGRYIGILLQTWYAFPAEYLRNPELSFSHHRYAAETEDPSAWIEKASREQLSVRQLQLAIQGGVIETAEQISQKKAEHVFVEVKRIMERRDLISDWLGGELAKFFHWG